MANEAWYQLASAHYTAPDDGFSLLQNLLYLFSHFYFIHDTLRKGTSIWSFTGEGLKTIGKNGDLKKKNHQNGRNRETRDSWEKGTRVDWN